MHTDESVKNPIRGLASSPYVAGHEWVWRLIA
jgi:hypothetical protein